VLLNPWAGIQCDTDWHFFYETQFYSKRNLVCCGSRTAGDHPVHRTIYGLCVAGMRSALWRCESDDVDDHSAKKSL